jgi:hypothetical protein
LALSPGYFVLDGLSIEPQIGMLVQKNEKPAWLFLGSLSYTYAIPQSNVAPFLRAGYGVSNAIPLPIDHTLIGRATDKLDVGVLELGGGLKLKATEGAYLRAEIGYRKSSWSREYSWYGYSTTIDYTYSTIALALGFTVIL